MQDLAQVDFSLKEEGGQGLHSRQQLFDELYKMNYPLHLGASLKSPEMDRYQHQHIQLKISFYLFANKPK